MMKIMKYGFSHKKYKTSKQALVSSSLDDEILQANGRTDKV